MIYRAIGKAVVKYGFIFAKRRYGRPVGIGLAALAVGIAAYIATRDVPEG